MPHPTPGSRGRHQSLVRASIRNSRAPIMTCHQCPRINTLVWPGPAREQGRSGQEAPPVRRLSLLLWQPLSRVVVSCVTLVSLASYCLSISSPCPGTSSTLNSRPSLAPTLDNGHIACRKMPPFCYLLQILPFHSFPHASPLLPLFLTLPHPSLAHAAHAPQATATRNVHHHTVRHRRGDEHDLQRHPVLHVSFFFIA